MYIVDIKRTPVGKFLGSLSNFSAPQLTKPLFSYFLKIYPFLKNKTDEVIMGNVLSAGIGMNPARIAAYNGGIGESVPAYTVNHVCASGMNAIIQGYRSILSGENNLVLAGGMESMSQAPFLLKEGRKMKFGSHTLLDSLQNDGLYCGLCNKTMGETAENIAQKYSISRVAQDKYSVESHKKALKAQKDRIFSSEIIEIAGFNIDESPRIDSSLKKLASLKASFKTKGNVTAGNSSTISDGAVLALLASEKALKKYGLKPIAQILDTVFVGLKPELMGLGPKYAIKKLLKRNSLSIKDIDLFEINEAFAVQMLAVIQDLKINQKRVNVHGGSIALGHPLGMTGARIMLSLITALRKTGGKIGIASLCVGGGQGVGVLIKTL